MRVVQNLVPPPKYNIKCPYVMTPEFYVVHNTANDASAKNEIAYMLKNNNKVSYHYAIDDREVIQAIPETRNAWHAGDGNGPGNRKGIGIEICYSKSGGKKFEEAEKLAAKFIAKGLKEKGWGIDRVKKHQDFSGKYCPHRTLDLGWQRFLNMIQNELNKLKGAEKVTDKNKPSSWAKEAWEWAKKEGYLDGTRPKDPITREEMVIVIKRLVDKNE
ncbi:MAG TPA: N-acetylmuramoyl-L-alanine amidase [Acetivibrio sp.]|mgnify:CR=1 FL=1|nr:N-acetylmuramoyl-L-alanine amidase [Acetivibrio sp.]